jgi:hypothetical protein
MTQAVSQTEGLDVSPRAKENLLYIGTNLKGDRLKVPDDTGCEPDRGLGCVPEGEGELALKYIGTNPKGDRLEVPDDPCRKPDGGLGGVPVGEGKLAL